MSVTIKSLPAKVTLPADTDVHVVTIDDGVNVDGRKPTSVYLKVESDSPGSVKFAVGKDPTSGTNAAPLELAAGEDIWLRIYGGGKEDSNKLRAQGVANSSTFRISI